MSQQNPPKRVKYEQSDEFYSSNPRGFNAPPPRGHYEDRGMLQRAPRTQGNMPAPPHRGYDDYGAPGFTRGPSFPHGPYDDRGYPSPQPRGFRQPLPIGYYDNRGLYNRDAPPPIPLQRSVSDSYNRNRSKNFGDSCDTDISAPRDFRFNHRDAHYGHPFPARPPLENLVIPHRREGSREEWKAKANNMNNQPPPQDPYYNNSMQRDRPMVKKYFAFRRIHNPTEDNSHSRTTSNTVSAPSNNVTKNEVSKPRKVIRNQEIISLTNTIDTIMDYKMALALLPLNIILDDPVVPSGSSNSNKEALNLLNPAVLNSKSMPTPRQVTGTPNTNNNNNNNIDKVRGTPAGAISNRTPETNVSGQRTSSAPNSQGLHRHSSNNPPQHGSNHR